MRSCDLRHSIVIEAPQDTQASDGQATKEYVTFANARAKIDPQVPSERRAELFVGDAKYAEARTVITIRYLSGVNEKMRVLHRGVYYDIRGVRNLDMRNAWLELHCHSGLADAA